jgi:signal transduction histidine kinase
MKIAKIVDFFIHPDYRLDTLQYRKARLLVRACLLTSIFSNSYVWLSVYFEYPKGVYLMLFNVVGFLILSFLVKTKIQLKLLAYCYVLFGAVAIIVLTYYSGGVWSAIYPWIIAIPVLALLVVDRNAGMIWTVISFSVMVWFAALAYQGVELPVEYNPELRTLWYITIVPGLLLIIMVISFVFESTQNKALQDLEDQNKILEEQKTTIAAQSEKLEILIEDKDQIIRILAHDLKNPLANITTISNILKEEKEIDQQKKFIAMIEQVSSKAQGLVNDVLEMAILEQGGIKLKNEEIEVNKAITEAMDSIVESAKRKNINVLFENGKELIKVKANKTYLHLIFENLISNAIKFSEPKTEVRISISTSNNHVQVRVMDEGPGILPEEESLLFEKFSKLSARPTDNESSTGLGLSLVKYYAEHIGGSVSYDSEASKGATFVLDLPISKM